MKNILNRLLLLILLVQSSQLHAFELQPRIIGGEDADPGEWPATAAILSASIYNNSLSFGTGEAQYRAQYCGGSIVAAKWILTAAHCLYDDNNNRLQADDILVLAGVTSLSDSGQLSEVSRVFIHPNYNQISQDSDIAMLELATELVSPTQSISLFTGDPAAGSSAMVVGWGITRSVPNFPYVLQEVELQVVSQSDCNAPSAYDGNLTDNMLCAAAPDKDSCGGDSGGPLMALQDAEYRQIGIVSFGNDCAVPEFPGVYTRVERFDSWISDTLAGLNNDNNDDGGGGSFGWVLLPLCLLFYRRQSPSRRLTG